MSTTPDGRPRGWNVTEQLAAKEPAPMPRPTKAPEIANPAVGAGWLGLTIEQVHDAAGDELRLDVDATLVNAAWVARQRAVRMHSPTGFVPCTPEQHLADVLEEATRRKANRLRVERQQRAADLAKTCPVTGAVDATTSTRWLPWQTGNASTIVVSDRGVLALLAAALRAVPADDLERATAMLAGILPTLPTDPPPPDEPTAEPKRRGLRR